MAYVTAKKIKGKKYLYLVKSIRLPDGSVHKLQRLLKAMPKSLRRAEKENKQFFEDKAKQAYADWAAKSFRADSIFTAEEFGKIEAARLGFRALQKNLTKPQLKDALDRFTANFTYESNALEGNSLTLKDVAIVMFENRGAEGKDLREIYETRNSRRVLELLYKKKFGLDPTSSIKMHKMLMKDIPAAAGFKKVPNFLLGRSVETAPPEKVALEMDSLFGWCGKNPERLHPLQLAARFHGKFEKIHPFEDGNGRVGRFLVNVILMNHGYPPLIVRKTQRQSYLKALEAFDMGYAQSLERFFLERFKKTYKNFFGVYSKYI